MPMKVVHTETRQIELNYTSCPSYTTIDARSLVTRVSVTT